MKVLCVHHKGGVGKTTTAIHVTGVLLLINYEYLWSEPGYEHLWQYYKQVLI